MACVDLRRGTYRYLWSGARTGRRINSASRDAEFWFWRVHMICDDYGCFPADPLRCRAEAAPLRTDITDELVAGWLTELAEHGLVAMYDADGERFGAIVGFTAMQPKGRNGKRVSRFPMPDGMDGESGCIQGNPDESTSTQVHPGESRLIQIDPGESQNGGAPHNDAQTVSGADDATRRVNPGESKGIQRNPGEGSAPHAHAQAHAQAQSNTQAHRPRSDSVPGHSARSRSDSDPPATGPAVRAPTGTEPSRAGPPDDRAWAGAVGLRIAEALGLSADRAVGQRRAINATIAQFIDREDRDAVATQVIAKAAELRSTPFIDSPVRAWQAAMNRRFGKGRR